MILGFNKLILKFMWRGKRPRIIKIIQKKNIVGRLMLPTLRFHYKATVIKTSTLVTAVAAAKLLQLCPTL